MAISLQWIPDSLYNYSISSVVTNYSRYDKDLRTFHGGIIFDVYYKLYKEGLLLELGKEFENINIFEKVLKVNDKRHLLHNCFQALMDGGYQIAFKLAEAYNVLGACDSTNKDKHIQLGLSLGIFLSDAGWFLQSESILTTCLHLCCLNTTSETLPLLVECYRRLLQVRNGYCKLEEAEITFKEALVVVESIKNLHLKINFACLYSEFSTFYFIRSNYKEAYNWGVKAVNELDSTLSIKDLVHVLCIASKACVVKKQYKQAEFLIKEAVQRARERFGLCHLLVADTLNHYGHYLLHNDSVEHAVRVYQRALDIRTNIIGGKNLLVAIAHEDLAYALYVHEYGSGRFNDARDHVEKALHMKVSLLDENNFLLTSAKRINALILEEIANDSHDKEIQRRYYSDAEELHLSSLAITKRCLGKMAVHTGKHYGNLGRLYQSMRKFKLAQTMHLKAIAIKEQILGPNDYEVAISIGHLASLYNYDLELFKEAEALYLRSISIALRQFGESYSGLEYDYRGLLRVYSTLGESTKLVQLYSVLQDWKLLRDQTVADATKACPLDFKVDLIKPENIHACFTSLQ